MLNVDVNLHQLLLLALFMNAVISLGAVCGAKKKKQTKRKKKQNKHLSL